MAQVVIRADGTTRWSSAHPKFLNSSDVLEEHYAGSKMQLYRDIKLGLFPAPDELIGRKNIWYRETIDRYREARRAAAQAKYAPQLEVA